MEIEDRDGWIMTQANEIMAFMNHFESVLGTYLLSDEYLIDDDKDARDGLTEMIDRMYQSTLKFRPSANPYATMINDLTMVLEMRLDGYSFDEDHHEKHRALLERACVLIGKPRTIEELGSMLGHELSDDDLRRISTERMDHIEWMYNWMRGNTQSVACKRRDLTTRMDEL